MAYFSRRVFAAAFFPLYFGAVATPPEPHPTDGGGTGISQKKRKKDDDLLVNTHYDELWAVANVLTPALPPRVRIRTVGADGTSNTVRTLSPQLAALFALAFDQLDE